MRKRASDITMRAFGTFIGASEPEIVSVGLQVPIPRFESRVIFELCSEAVDFLRPRGGLVEIHGPTYVVGDLHGNFHDLIRIYNSIYESGNLTVVFLGDYVDRGAYSTEVVLFIFTILCKYPNNVVLLRGNHEFPVTHEGHTNFLLEELKVSYPEEFQQLYDSIQFTFAWLPLAALINDDVLCVHGGLSPLLNNVDQLRSVRYPIFNYDDPMIGDLLWSDPYLHVNHFIASTRGVGQFFGSGAAKNFLTNNNLKYLIRAHQCVIDGVEESLKDVFTVFSSSFYTDEENKSGFIYLDASSQMKIYTLRPLMSIKRAKAHFYDHVSVHTQKTKMFSLTHYTSVLTNSATYLNPMNAIARPNVNHSRLVLKGAKKRRTISFSQTFDLSSNNHAC